MQADTPDHGHEDTIGPDLTALERRLAAWRPAAGALDRDRMLYDAGRATAGARAWRFATAALLLATAALSGLLLDRGSSLARERALLARERAQRLELETALAARTGALQQSNQTFAPAAEPAAPEPPAPSSYLVLTSRLAEGVDAALSTDAGIPPGPRRPASGPAGDEWHPTPLRSQDIRRILDL